MASDPHSNRPAPGRFGQSRSHGFDDGPAGGGSPLSDGSPGSGLPSDPGDEWTLEDAGHQVPPSPAPVPAGSFDDTPDPEEPANTRPDETEVADPAAADSGGQEADSGDPPAQRDTVQRSLTRRDFVTMAAAVAVLLVAAAGFVRALMAGKPYSPPPAARVKPDLPMKGELVTITDVQTGWRTRRESDRVTLMDVILPSPSQVYPELLPVISVTVDPSASSSGFIKFIVRNDEHRITGDVRILTVSGGRIVGEGAGESPETGTVYGTTGMLDRIAYFTYAASEGQRWYVEVSESASQNANEEDWRPLGTFEIRNSLRND